MPDDNALRCVNCDRELPSEAAECTVCAPALDQGQLYGSVTRNQPSGLHLTPKNITICMFSIVSAALAVSQYVFDIFGVYKEYNEQYDRMISWACQGYSHEAKRNFGECKGFVQDATELYSTIKAKSLVEKGLSYVVLGCREPNLEVGDHTSYTWMGSVEFLSCLKTFAAGEKGDGFILSLSRAYSSAEKVENGITLD